MTLYDDIISCFFRLTRLRVVVLSYRILVCGIYGGFLVFSKKKEGKKRHHLCIKKIKNKWINKTNVGSWVEFNLYKLKFNICIPEYFATWRSLQTQTKLLFNCWVGFCQVIGLNISQWFLCNFQGLNQLLIFFWI